MIGMQAKNAHKLFICGGKTNLRVNLHVSIRECETKTRAQSKIKKPMMIRVEIDDWGPLTVIETMPVADLAIGMCTRFGTLSTSTIFINS